MSGPRTARELLAWPEMQRSSVFSADRRYRFRLERRWGPGPVALFVCHNPSIAGRRSDPDDARTEIDDPTAARMMSFAWFWGCDGLLVGNLGALVSTHPDGLIGVPDPIGPDNDAHIVEMAAQAVIRIAAWGAGPLAVTSRASKVLDLLVQFGDVHCLARTADGYPRHPLARGRHRVLDETWPQPFVYVEGAPGA